MKKTKVSHKAVIALAGITETNLLDAIFHCSQDYIALLDVNFNFLKVNLAYAALYNKKISDFENKNYFKLKLHLIDNKKIFQAIIQTKKIISGVGRLKLGRSSAGESWHWRLCPILGNDKQVKMIWLELKDGTSERQAFEEIVSLSKFPAENPNPVLRINTQGAILYHNIAFSKIAKKHNVENNIKLILPKGMLAFVQKSIKLNKVINDIEISLEEKVYSYNIMPVCAQGYANVYGQDITNIKNTQTTLIQAEQDLLEQQKILKEKNIALSIVLEQIHSEKEAIKKDIAKNLEQIVYPIWEKIKYNSGSTPYRDLMDKALKEITAPYSSFLTNANTALSSREIEICNMIKSGFSSKQISKFLNISVQTIEKHRFHIRSKLKLRNKRKNLYTYLQSKSLSI